VEGSSLTTINEAGSGDIVIINGLDAACGQYIGHKPENSSQIQFVNPLITMNVAARDKSQSMELAKALHVLNEEDPYLNVRHDKYTGQECVSLMGEIQAQIIQTMLLERFNIDSELVDPVLIHRETPTREGVGVATYTKVSGVKIEVKPLPPGSGVVYNSKLSTDFLLKKYQRQTERLVRMYMHQGVFGWEITDAEISLVDGRFDSMGSDPMHFNIAVPLALMRALKDSKMRILEPISRFTITIPRVHLSEVVKALSGFNSAFEVTKDDSEEITIEGEARYSHMLYFSNTLMGLTGGRGVYSSYLSRYETSNNQNVTKNYLGPDPRNETVFVINEMGGSLDALDKPFTKKKKESSAKFKRQQKEKMYTKKGSH
jgi:ribosomal protection tetracycline resistance protein